MSPWSSKATDIAHNCGLAAVLRLERGVRYRFHGAPVGGIGAAAPLLHDRMTQSVFSSVSEAEQLFHTGTPAPLAHARAAPPSRR